MRRTHHPRQEPRAYYFYGNWSPEDEYITDRYQIAVVHHDGNYYLMETHTLKTKHGIKTDSPDQSSYWTNYKSKIPRVRTEWLESGPIYITDRKIELLKE